MDMLYIPPNVGVLPSSAMTEIEIRTTLQKMLELEERYKMDRLQSAPTSPPMSPALPSDSQHRPPLQIRRADSLSRQQNWLMLKAARRTTTLPSLSIAIPQPAKSAVYDLPDQEFDEDEDDGEDTETETTTAEPLHKQVKFLAPDKDDDEMSDQSSICQSPSWEGYGQRKKEKKMEAERRKREKEQADKEAKAAKKRLATRLSKAPPPPPALGRGPAQFGLTNAERSMSDPLLNRPHASLGSQLVHQPQDVERASSTTDLQNSRLQNRSDAETPPDIAANARRFVGGVKLELERGAMVQTTLQSMYPPSLPYQLIQTSGPEPRKIGPVSPSLPAARQENRSPRETAFPPSASRTPMLRHMTGSGHSRSNSLLQGATKFLRGQDGKSHGDSEISPTSEPPELSQIDQASERGRDRGLSRHQRASSTSRTVDSLTDEQNPGNGSAHSSSTRSSSRNTRRSSITQEAKSMAMKLTGKKVTPSAKEEFSGYVPKSNSQVDYFNFMGDSYNSSVLTAMVSGGGAPPRPTTRDSVRHAPKTEHLEVASARGIKPQKQESPPGQEPSTTPQNSGSHELSTTNSVASSHGRKGRSLRDAAKAALHIKGSGTPANTSKPLVSAPPYLAFRTRVQSNSAENKIQPSHPREIPEPVPPPDASILSQNSGHPSASNSVKTTELETQTNSRASEGSSTSSAYEGTSPIPSPTTTPDTSRPQSSKDLPLHIDDPRGSNGSLVVQDDDRTLRQSSDGSRSSNTSTTPRLEDSQERKSLEMTDEDRWSRSALPLEIDCDAQSFTTTFSNLDNQENAEEGSKLSGTEDLNRARKDATQSHTDIWSALNMALSQPKLAKALSDPAIRHGVPNNMTHDIFSPPIEKPVAIPPRSKKRDSPKEPSKDGSSPGQQTRQGPPQDSQKSQVAPQDEAPEKRHMMAVGVVTRRDGREVGESREELVPRGYREKDGREETGLKRESKRERVKRQRPEKGPRFHEHDMREDSGPSGEAGYDEEAGRVRSSGSTPTPPSSLTRTSTSSSLSSSNSTRPSVRSPMRSPMTSPLRGTFGPLSDSPTDTHEMSESKHSPAGSRVSTPDLSYHAPPKPPGPSRMASAPTPSSSDSYTSSTLPVAPLGPSASRPAGPVSILKHPTRSTSDPSQAGGGGGPQQPPSTGPPRSSTQPVLSALPKHMQLQAGISVRSPTTTSAVENRMAPIAKMFVECCNCKFYHDMPSKLYECMAKPDAVVEDRALGISGAITTMVKCPWCAHNMSTNCCAGYAAVVYLKEKLH